MQECSQADKQDWIYTYEMNHIFCLRIFAALTNTLATSWDMPALVLLKRLEKMVFETLELSLLKSSSTTMTAGCVLLGVPSIMIWVSLLTVRSWNSPLFVDPIVGFGGDGYRPVVFKLATLLDVVVVGRASSSSLVPVRSTSFMLLFKLLVILWNEKKH